MEPLLIALLAVAAVVIQTAFVPLISVGGAGPDVIFLLVVFFALQRSTTLGLWTAFSLGLLQDIACGGPLGLNALLLLIMAYLISWVRNRFFKEHAPAQVMILVMATFLHQFLTFFWANTVLDTAFGFDRFLFRALGRTLYHVLLGPLLFQGLRHLIRGEDVHHQVIVPNRRPTWLSILERRK